MKYERADCHHAHGLNYCALNILSNVYLFVFLLLHILQFLLFYPVSILRLSRLSSLSSLSVWASSGQLQAAQCPYHISGMEPHRLQCVCCLWSRWCPQPMGSVGGVMWHGWAGWRLKEAPTTAAVLASGPDRGQGAPLAPTDPRNAHLHCVIRIQRVQDYFGVKSKRVYVCFRALWQ